MIRYIFFSVAGHVKIAVNLMGEEGILWDEKQRQIFIWFKPLWDHSVFPSLWSVDFPLKICNMLLLHMSLSHPLWSKLGDWQFTVPGIFFFPFISVLFSASGRFYIQYVLSVITPSKSKLLNLFLGYKVWEWNPWSFWWHVYF